MNKLFGNYLKYCWETIFCDSPMFLGILEAETLTVFVLGYLFKQVSI